MPRHEIYVEYFPGIIICSDLDKWPKRSQSTKLKIYKIKHHNSKPNCELKADYSIQILKRINKLNEENIAVRQL